MVQWAMLMEESFSYANHQIILDAMINLHQASFKQTSY